MKAIEEGYAKDYQELIKKYYEGLGKMERENGFSRMLSLQLVRKDKTISKFYNLTEVITDENYRAEFLNYVFDIVAK